MVRLANITAVILFLCCCYGESALSDGDRISIAGSSTCLPSVSRAAEEFMRQHPQVTITVSAGGSGVGVSALAGGTVDIGMISRGISRKELRDYPEVNFVLTPFARDAVVPVVSSEVYESGVTCLSMSQLRDIYSGALKDWRELGGPDRSILVVDKEPDRGTRHVFMKAVFGDKHAKAAGATIITGSNDDMQMAVATSNTAIGFLSQAWTNPDVRGLGIKTGRKIIHPTHDNIKSGDFPISRDLTLITNGPPHDTAREFIDFILGREGHRIITEAHLIPVR